VISTDGNELKVLLDSGQGGEGKDGNPQVILVSHPDLGEVSVVGYRDSGDSYTLDLLLELSVEQQRLAPSHSQTAHVEDVEFVNPRLEEARQASLSA
jgi:hypothetical protein